jgi:hypothetical protein
MSNLPLYMSLRAFAAKQSPHYDEIPPLRRTFILRGREPSFQRILQRYVELDEIVYS